MKTHASLGLLLLMIACSGRDISLGRNRPAASGNGSGSGDAPPALSLGGAGGGSSAPLVRPRFGNLEWREELSSDIQQDDPALTSDLLEIFFASTRAMGSGREDVWKASRERPDEPFGEPVPVTEVNSEERETAASISSDGLVLWFSSDRDDPNGDLDIYRAVRTSRSEPFGTPELLTIYQTDTDELVRSPNQEGRFLPLARLSESTSFDMLLAERTQGIDYGAPVFIEELNSASGETDPTLSADGLILVFASDREDEAGDLYIATRGAREETFSLPEPLSELNTEFEESDPWLSGDGKHLFFSSRRSGRLQIYEATAR